MYKLKIFNIFKKGSKTYFYSSIFFPKGIRHDVFILYSFVRTADDLVDSVPQKKVEFEKFYKDYVLQLSGLKGNSQVIQEYIKMAKIRKFDPQWTEAFLKSMAMDLSKSRYQSISELNTYIYGSAEVIGLMMARILDLPKEAYPYAQKLGKAMQYANFIRDFKEDIEMNRLYFPILDFCVKNIDTTNLTKIRQRKDIEKFLNCQIEKFNEWQREAESGFKYIPKRYLIPIKTASDMYKWTVKKISQNPYIVFNKKIKPSVMQIISTIVYNALTI